MYCWTGIWTSFFLALASVFNLSDLINYCTRFTDDCFNALIALNFLSEAVFSIVRGFSKSTMGDFTTGLSSMNLSLIMWFSTQVYNYILIYLLFQSKAYNLTTAIKWSFQTHRTEISFAQAVNCPE